MWSIEQVYIELGAKRVKNFRGQRKTHILLDLSEHWIRHGYSKFKSQTLMMLPIQKGIPGKGTPGKEFQGREHQGKEIQGKKHQHL